MKTHCLVLALVMCAQAVTLSQHDQAGAAQITFLDSDTLATPSATAAQVLVLARRPGADTAFVNVKWRGAARGDILEITLPRDEFAAYLATSGVPGREDPASFVQLVRALLAAYNVASVKVDNAATGGAR